MDKKFEKKKIVEILDILNRQYPDACCELSYRTPFQLLVSTMLSAQSTDKSVNKVTKRLFEQYPDIDSFMTLKQPELESLIKEIGLYRTKAANILGMCKEIQKRFGGKVPDDMDSLTSLPGVGRKTANVVLSNAFGIPAIAVDTHVFRVSNKIGLADAKNVAETEKQLMQGIPEEQWSKAHHLLIWHGRRICTAKNPKCEQCPLNSLCYCFKNSRL